MKIDPRFIGTLIAASLVACLILIAVAWAMFWCLGALFGVTIPVTFKTVIAANILLAMVVGPKLK